MKRWVDGENTTVWPCIDTTVQEEEGMQARQIISEDFETHTGLNHVLYSSNSLSVYRLQVQHCMLVWDWQLRPRHCGLEYVQY